MCKALAVFDDILSSPWALGLYFPFNLPILSPFVPFKTKILISELAAAANASM